jgi:NTP pyrophosphatase (non-canonical NTP hydrolase)
MIFDDYQQGAEEYATYPGRMLRSGIMYAGLVLTEEAGEAAGKIKRYIRGDMGYAELQEGIEKELGDVLWAMAELCTQLNLSMDRVAEVSLRKLASRKERGMLHGSGDDR